MKTNWKRQVAMLFLVLVTTTCWSNPHDPDFELDGIYYYVLQNNSTAVGVTYHKLLPNNHHYTYSGEVSIPDRIEYGGKQYTVKEIGPGAFFHCDVTKVHLPGTITFIGYEAFEECSQLIEINIPASVRTIERGAFCRTSISSVTIPEGVTELPYQVFFQSQLEDITLPKSLKSIEKEVFAQTKIQHIILPEGLETIGMKAFRQAELLEQIVIPSTVKTIETYAFANDKSLKSVLFTQPSMLETIAECSFMDTGILSVVIPGSVKTIDKYAFIDNSCLESVSFSTPSSLSTIGDGVFRYSPLIGKIVIPASVDSIGSNAFCDCKNDAGTFDIEFEDGNQIRTIGNETFANSNLLSINIPTTVKSLGMRAFYNVNTIEEIVLPEGLLTIGDNCFVECDSLKRVNVPSTVTHIGAHALSSPKRKMELYFAANEAQLGEAAFQNVPTIHIQDQEAWTRLVVKYAPFRSPWSSTTYHCSTFAHIYLDGKLVTDYVVPEGIIDIEDNAFYDYPDLKSVSLPNSLTKIGGQAFYKCTALETIVFGNSIQEVGDEAFRYDTAIETVDIGDLANWCSISFYASTSNPLSQAEKIVLNGKQLESLNIPTKVTRIGNFAFNGCRYFSKVTIPNNVATIGAYAFNNCIDLEIVKFGSRSMLEHIDTYAFSGTAINDITLPPTVTSIGVRAFLGCKMLESIVIPEKMKEISVGTFGECIKLAQVTLPEGLEKIGTRAFTRCFALKDIVMPISLKEMGGYAFGDVDINVHIKDLFSWCQVEVEIPGRYPWCGTQHLYMDGKLIKEMEIPIGVTSLCHHLFYRAIDLKTLKIPEGMKTIDSNCFQNCYNLREIHVPTTLEYVGASAFELPSSRDFEIPSDHTAFYTEDLTSFINSHMATNAYSDSNNSGIFSTLYLKGDLVTDLIIPEGIKVLEKVFIDFSFNSVTLPNSLESIDPDAFSKCRGLQYLYCRGKYAAQAKVSYGDNGIRRKLTGIYVPAGRVANYQNNWPYNKNLIFEAPENVSPTGVLSATSLSEEVNAHKFVYDEPVPYLDLTEVTLDETITEETLQGIAEDGTIIFLPDGTEGMEGTNIVANSRTPKLILKDGADFSAPYDFLVDELEYQRSFLASRTEATTLCLPFSLATLPKGMKAYSLQGQNADGNVVFEEVELVEANRPYLITTSLKVDDLCAENVLVKATPATMPDAGCEEYEFYGTLSTMSHEDAADEEAFVLSEGMQWQSVYDADEDVTVPAGRAYLIPTDVVSSTFGIELTTTTPIEFIVADANGDGMISVVDVVYIIGYITGNVPNPFFSDAADANGDEIINIFDVTKAVNIILGFDDEEEVESKERKTGNGSSATLFTSMENGRTNLMLERADDFIAMQFDVVVPEGKELLNVSLNSVADHAMAFGRTGENRYTVIAYSMSNATFRTTDDVLASLQISDDNVAFIEKATLITKDGCCIDVNVVNLSTGIATVKCENGTDAVYTLSGQLVGTDTKSLPKGVYIRGGRKIIVK